MAALRDRLSWQADDGAVHDGPRRYLLMRPDVLMGALVALPREARGPFLQAWAASTQHHGAGSLQAYAQAVNGDHQALVAATVAAAADLGWGHWQIVAQAQRWTLSVHNSPFVAGWHAAGGGHSEQTLCAPIAGMASALASALRGRPVRVLERHCAAQGPKGPQQPHTHETCEFVLEEAA